MSEEFSNGIQGRFSGDRIQKIERAVVTGTQTELLHGLLYEWKHGKGLIYYCPIPLELADQSWLPYQLAFNPAGAQRYPSMAGLLGRIVQFQDTTLYIYVSEANNSLADTAIGPFGMRVAYGSIALVFQDSQSKQVIAKFQPEE
jgi:hypothetical protein